ncbi:hypothetical protein QDY71_04120 [Kingella negevensis]|uniref:hypothetical protein n=1 Tax=Kingella negevensis TaxID=1522312 RepID=UPI000BA41664|nr:hypothetical protein [Kingella negevensis]MDK4679799.1 hypothetical protein [Kingella negevensis]MDK4682482.1 hypothetical protein [Kingella negevensis]MDK4690678.1 hypothetical protein [Kingella negevensis]MDK4694174.1 hypothetical protein [Kingella negevensis]MDK4696956.1 hypothetical protein [Kingella negevensis]
MDKPNAPNIAQEFFIAADNVLIEYRTCALIGFGASRDGVTPFVHDYSFFRLPESFELLVF